MYYTKTIDNQFGEIVHDESGEDFLENVLRFFLRENGADQSYI